MFSLYNLAVLVLLVELEGSFITNGNHVSVEEFLPLKPKGEVSVSS